MIPAKTHTHMLKKIRDSCNYCDITKKTPSGQVPAEVRPSLGK